MFVVHLGLCDCGFLQEDWLLQHSVGTEKQASRLNQSTDLRETSRASLLYQVNVRDIFKRKSHNGARY